MPAEDVGHLAPEGDEGRAREVEGRDDPVELLDLVKVDGDEGQGAGHDGDVEGLEGKGHQEACDQLEPVDERPVALRLALSTWPWALEGAGWRAISDGLTLMRAEELGLVWGHPDVDGRTDVL